MSTWIDFAVYATLIALFFVFLPRSSRQYTLPTIADRNPAWASDHRDVVARLESGGWFLYACYLWAALSIGALLGVKLELIGPFDDAVPKWEVLKDLAHTFLIAGAALWSVCALLWFQWVRKNVPLAETRRATLKPRVASDYLALPWRVTVETLTVLHLGAWVALSVRGFVDGADYVRDPDYWFGFALVVVATVIFAVVAAVVPRRRPSFADTIFGAGMRRFELRVSYLFRLAPLIAGAMLIGKYVYDLDPDRIGTLLNWSLLITGLVQFLRLRPVAPAGPRFSVESRLNA